MKIRIQLFAHARQLAGGPELWIDVPEPATASAVREALIAQHAALAPLVRQSLLAVGTEYARGDQIVSAEDELALIPPVSGG